MAEPKIYVGKEGAKALYSRVKGDIATLGADVDGKLDLKADKTELSEAVTALGQRIDTKASADDLSTAVSGLEAQIDTKASADDLSTAVSGLEAQIETKASADDLSTAVSGLEAQIETKADADTVTSELALKEDLANKVTSFGVQPTNTQYPSALLVKTEIDRLQHVIANLGGFEVVTTLVDGHPNPEIPSHKIIYLYKDPEGPEADPYTEWIYTVDNEWDVIGTTYVDLTPYYTKIQVNDLLDGKADKSAMSITQGTGTATIQLKEGTSATVLTDGAYAAGAGLSLEDRTMYVTPGITDDELFTTKNGTVAWVEDEFGVIEAPGNTVTIGNKEYPVVKIGNQVWMSADLELKTDNMEIGTAMADWLPRVWYYKNDPATGYGLLYNSYAKDYLVAHAETLFPGWHIPSDDDWNQLFCTVMGISDITDATAELRKAASIALRAEMSCYGTPMIWNEQAGGFDYTDIPGTNSSGFNSLMGGTMGYGNYSMEFSAASVDTPVRECVNYWSSTAVNDMHFVHLESNECRSYTDGAGARRGCYIRLVKNDSELPSGNRKIRKTVGGYSVIAERAVSDENGENIHSRIAKVDGMEPGAQENIIERVKLSGDVLTVTDKSVNIPLASATSSGGATTYVTGVISGQDKEKWDSWGSHDYDIPISSIVVGGLEYGVVRIGNQLWTTENLNYTWQGLSIGEQSTTPDGTPKAWYAMNQPDTYGYNGLKYGLGYNRSAIEYIIEHASEIFPAGWHLPALDEYETMFTYVANDPACTDPVGTALKSTSGWNSDGNGTDHYGFNVKPAGTAVAGATGGPSYKFGEEGYMMSVTLGGNGNIYPRGVYLKYNETGVSGIQGSRSDGYTYRLVKTLG